VDASLHTDSFNYIPAGEVSFFDDLISNPLRAPPFINFLSPPNFWSERFFQSVFARPLSIFVRRESSSGRHLAPPTFFFKEFSRLLGITLSSAQSPKSFGLEFGGGLNANGRVAIFDPSYSPTKRVLKWEGFAQRPVAGPLRGFNPGFRLFITLSK